MSTTVTENLDQLLGYTGSIQISPISEALDEQRKVLWEAAAIIEVTAHAIEREYGQDWPANVPEFPRALRRAAKMINEASGAIEDGILEDRALAIARAARDEAASAMSLDEVQS